MKKMMMILALLFAMVGSSFGWKHSPKVTIDQVIFYADGSGVSSGSDTNSWVVFVLSDGTKVYCYENEKTTISMMLNCMNNKKEVECHAEDLVESVGGFPVHKLHRIVTYK